MRDREGLRRAAGRTDLKTEVDLTDRRARGYQPPGLQVSQHSQDVYGAGFLIAGERPDHFTITVLQQCPLLTSEGAGADLVGAPGPPVGVVYPDHDLGRTGRAREPDVIGGFGVR